MTVVGLLIAGEIYIHFQSKEVEHAKMSELLSAIKKSVPELKVPDEMENIQGSNFSTMHFGVYFLSKSDSVINKKHFLQWADFEIVMKLREEWNVKLCSFRELHQPYHYITFVYYPNDFSCGVKVLLYAW